MSEVRDDAEDDATLVDDLVEVEIEIEVDASHLAHQAAQHTADLPGDPAALIEEERCGQGEGLPEQATVEHDCVEEEESGNARSTRERRKRVVLVPPKQAWAAEETRRAQMRALLSSTHAHPPNAGWRRRTHVSRDTPAAANETLPDETVADENSQAVTTESDRTLRRMQALRDAAQVSFCLCAYLQMHTHSYILANVPTCVYAYIHNAYICTRAQTCIYAYMHMYIHAYVHTYIYSHIHTYTHTHIQTYKHSFIQTYAHIYMQRTRTRRVSERERQEGRERETGGERERERRGEKEGREGLV